MPMTSQAIGKVTKGGNMKKEDNLGKEAMVLKVKCQDLLDSQIHKNMFFFKSLKLRHRGIEKKVPLEVTLNTATINMGVQMSLQDSDISFIYTSRSGIIW